VLCLKFVTGVPEVLSQACEDPSAKSGGSENGAGIVPRPHAGALLNPHRVHTRRVCGLVRWLAETFYPVVYPGAEDVAAEWLDSVSLRDARSSDESASAGPSTSAASSIERRIARSASSDVISCSSSGSRRSNWPARFRT
jgi:hypothetical protein